jgi:hypothetical protein
LSERWRFQIDGKRYGPVETGDLERFLAPPRLCRFMEVQREGSDDWISIGRKDDLNTALKRLGVELPSIREPQPEPEVAAKRASAASEPAPVTTVDEPAAAKEWRPGPVTLLRYWFAEKVDQFAEFVARHWLPFALVGLWGALNLGIYIYSRFDYATEREIVAAYVEVWNEYIALQDSKATEAQWQAFKDTATPRLQPLVDELTTNTSSQTPARRHLLWAGRDCLLPLIAAAGGERQPRVEFGFQQHLNAIEQLMRGESPKPIRGAPRF